MIVCSSVISSIWKDVCVPHENLRYKLQIILPAPAGIKIYVLAVSFVLHSKEGTGDLSVINQHLSLYPLHTLLEALPAPNVPVLSARGRANGREGKDNTRYLHVQEHTRRLGSTFSCSCLMLPPSSSHWQ